MSEIFDLHGKVALVTGASSGLGVRFAECLAENGAAVVLVARRADRLADLKARIEKSGGRVSRPLAHASALRSACAHRTTACKARRDIPRHHARAILRSRRDAADSPALAPPAACRHRPRAGIQRDEKNCAGRAGTRFLIFSSVRFATEKRKRAAPPRAARLGGRAPTYNTAVQNFVATQTAAQEHQPAAVRPSLDDVLRPASPCSRPEPGRAMTRVPSG